MIEILTIMFFLQLMNQLKFAAGSICYYSHNNNNFVKTECQFGCCSLNAKSPSEACCHQSNFFNIWFIPVLVITGFVVIFSVIFLIYVLKYKNKSQKTSQRVPDIAGSMFTEIYTSDLSNTNNSNPPVNTIKPQPIDASTLPSYNEASKMRRNETLPQYNAVTPL